MGPGGMVSNPIDALSLGLALMFGTAGLPHILMRFFTVPDAREARKSVVVATGLVGYFFLLTGIIGFGAMIFLTKDNPQFFTQMLKEGKTVYEMVGGTNMTAVHLSNALGGDLLLGFISAVSFATILAVVAGLTLSGASAVSHDIYASVIRKGKATKFSRGKHAYPGTTYRQDKKIAFVTLKDGDKIKVFDEEPVEEAKNDKKSDKGGDK